MKIKNYANGVMVLCDNDHVVDTVPYDEWAGSRQEAKYMNPETQSKPCEACSRKGI